MIGLDAPRKSLTHEDFAEIARMRESGLMWKEIGPKYNRSGPTLLITFSKYRKGEYKFGWKRWEDRYNRCLELKLEGKTNREIGEIVGTSRENVWSILARRGWDMETIAEVRNAPV